MDKTLLITGATGFLGSHLTKKFVDENYKVVILKRICSDPWRIKDVLDKICCYNVDKTGIESPFQENKIDIIIHAAVNYGRDGIVKTVETNINFPLKLSLKFKIKLFIPLKLTSSDSFIYFFVIGSPTKPASITIQSKPLTIFLILLWQVKS